MPVLTLCDILFHSLNWCKTTLFRFWSCSSITWLSLWVSFVVFIGAYDDTNFEPLQKAGDPYSKFVVTFYKSCSATSSIIIGHILIYKVFKSIYWPLISLTTCGFCPLPQNQQHLKALWFWIYWYHIYTLNMHINWLIVGQSLQSSTFSNQNMPYKSWGNTKYVIL